MAGLTPTRTGRVPTSTDRANTGLSPRELSAARRRRFLNKLYPYLFMAPALILVSAVFMYPIAFGIHNSMNERPLIGGEADFVGFEIYRAMLDRPAFWNAMSRSLIFVVGTIIGGMIMAVIFALVLYYVPAFKRTLRALSLIPWLVSGIAVAWMFRFLFNTDVGAISNLTALVGYNPGTWLGDPTRAIFVVIVANMWYLVPFGTLLLLAGLQMMDQDMFEAGKVDGASPFQLFRWITIPQLRAHLGVVLVVFSFAAWNTFDLIMAMTEGGPRGGTEVLGVYMYMRAFRALNFSEGAALMVVILLINAVLSIGYLYWLREDD